MENVTFLPPAKQKSNDLEEIAKALQVSNQALAGIINHVQEQARRVESLELRLVNTEELLAETQKKQNHITEPRDGYYSLTRIGQMYGPVIGPQYMGRFLRIVGLAKGSRYFDDESTTGSGTGSTVPRSEAFSRGMIDERIFRTHTEFYWNAKKVIEYIDRWLDRHGLMGCFSEHKNQKERHAFINGL